MKFIHTFILTILMIFLFAFKNLQTQIIEKSNYKDQSYKYIIEIKNKTNSTAETLDLETQNFIQNLILSTTNDFKNLKYKIETPEENFKKMQNLSEFKTSFSDQMFELFPYTIIFEFNTAEELKKFEQIYKNEPRFSNQIILNSSQNNFKKFFNRIDLIFNLLFTILFLAICLFISLSTRQVLQDQISTEQIFFLLGQSSKQFLTRFMKERIKHLLACLFLATIMSYLLVNSILTTLSLDSLSILSFELENFTFLKKSIYITISLFILSVLSVYTTVSFMKNALYGAENEI